MEEQTMKKIKISTTLKRQVNDFINQGATLVDIINYLFTCDYGVEEIIQILVDHFNCKRVLVRDTFFEYWGVLVA
jgi:hypothetical protein